MRPAVKGYLEDRDVDGNYIKMDLKDKEHEGVV
jgi:hypothetical protein